QVDPADVAQGQDGPFDPGGQAAELRGQVLRQVGERVGVYPAGQPDGAGQAAGGRVVQDPVPVGPDPVVLRADPAGLPAGPPGPGGFGDHPRARLDETQWFGEGQCHRSSSCRLYPTKRTALPAWTRTSVKPAAAR